MAKEYKLKPGGTDPADDIILAQAYLSRYNLATAANFTDELVSIREHLIQRFKATKSQKKKVRLAELRRQVERELLSAYRAAMEDLQIENENAAKYIYESMRKSYRDNIGLDSQTFDKVPADAINAWTDISSRELLGVGDDKRFFQPKKEIEKLFKNHSQQYRKVISAALAEGLGIEDSLDLIIQRGLKVDGIKNHNLRAITRTSIASSMRRAQEWSEDNNFADVITGFQWVSVLDTRTTFYCASQAGLVKKRRQDFDLLPPAHFGCRSIVTALTDFSDPKTMTQRTRIYDEEIVLDQSGERRTKFNLAKDTIRDIKVPDARTKYTAFDEFFKTLPENRKIQYLGPEKYKIYQTGNIGMKSLIDGAGKIRTVAELAKIAGIPEGGLQEIRRRNIPAYKPKESAAARKVRESA